MATAALPSSDSDLDEAECLRIANMVERLRATFPGMFPIMRGLIEAGLATGWRDVDYVGPPRDDPPGSVSCAQMYFPAAKAEQALLPRPRNGRRR